MLGRELLLCALQPLKQDQDLLVLLLQLPLEYLAIGVIFDVVLL